MLSGSPRGWLTDHAGHLAGLVFVTGFALLPFFRQALFVDDHAHFREAESVALSVGGPYSEKAGGMGWVRGEIPGEANGPIYFFVVGGLIRLLGDAPAVIHLALFPLHLAAVFSVYFLAGRFVQRPFFAALFWLASPHYWLTVNSLLVDALLASIVAIGISLWVEGWERDSTLLLAGGAIFQGLGILVKYTGFIALPVALAYSLIWSHRRFSGKIFWLAVPVGMSAAWFLLSRAIYGESHFWAVARGSLSFRGADRLATLAAFATATTPILVFAGVKNLLSKMIPCFWGGIGAFLLAGIVTPSIDVGTTLTLCGLASLFVMAIWPTSPGSAGGWLRSWILLGIVGLWVARGWVCARYLVVIGIPLVILSLQTLERWRFWEKIYRPVLVVLMVYGGLLGVANFQQAAVDPWVLRKVQTQMGSDPVRSFFYPAATLSGLPYYGEKRGWKPLNAGDTLPPGGILLLPTRRLPRAFWPNIQGVTVRGTLRAPRGLPLRLLGSKAGFYGSIWGPRPFGFSSEPSEIFYILEASKT